MKTYARIFMGLGIALWILALLAIPREWKSIIMFLLGIAIVGTAYALGREFSSKKNSTPKHNNHHEETSGEGKDGVL